MKMHACVLDVSIMMIRRPFCCIELKVHKVGFAVCGVRLGPACGCEWLNFCRGDGGWKRRAALTPQDSGRLEPASLASTRSQAPDKQSCLEWIASFSSWKSHRHFKSVVLVGGRKTRNFESF